MLCRFAFLTFSLLFYINLQNLQVISPGFYKKQARHLPEFSLFRCHACFPFTNNIYTVLISLKKYFAFDDLDRHICPVQSLKDAAPDKAACTYHFRCDSPPPLLRAGLVSCGL